MTVTVTLFARARELAGASRVVLDLPEDADRVADLRRGLASRFPALAPLIPHLLIALGNDYSRDEEVLPPGVEVSCFPPVSGG
jgi:molybdopterin converting factor small subunit